MKRIVLTVLLLLLPLSVSAESTFTQEDLDQVTAPVALYPDPLLSQVLIAATYPDQVKEAAEWSKKNDGKLKGDDAVKSVSDKGWDPSVASLTAFPDVLAMMDKNPSWVKKLGDAFLAEPDRVMDTVQQLRAKAKLAGNLQSNKQQTVKVQDANATQTIIIQPANPQYVYVPVYNPYYVYGVWWYPAPPYYYYPPYYQPPASGIAVGFTVGIVVGACLWGGFHWGHHDVYVNVQKYNSINVHNHIDVHADTASYKQDLRGKNPRAPAAAKRDLARTNAKAAMTDKGLNPADERLKLQGENHAKIQQELSTVQKQPPLSKPEGMKPSFDPGGKEMGNALKERESAGGVKEGLQNFGGKGEGPGGGGAHFDGGGRLEGAGGRLEGSGLGGLRR